jgi:hypothetical protein
VTNRGGVWYVDGVRVDSWRQALAKALETAECGPQRGNAAPILRKRGAGA